MRFETIKLAMILSLPAMPAMAEGDAVAGKIVFKKCFACHSVDGKNKVGPTLLDIEGRPVASLDGFKYSSAMSAFGADGKPWTEALLTEFIAAPRKVVNGTSMGFAGLKKTDEIEDLIAYLKNPAAVP